MAASYHLRFFPLSFCWRCPFLISISVKQDNFGLFVPLPPAVLQWAIQFRSDLLGDCWGEKKDKSGLCIIDLNNCSQKISVVLLKYFPHHNNSRIQVEKSWSKTTSINICPALKNTIFAQYFSMLHFYAEFTATASRDSSDKINVSL